IFMSFCPVKRCFYCLCLCSSERHYLHYMFTALTKEDVLPEYSAVGVVDDRRISDDSKEVPESIRLILNTYDETDALVQLCVSSYWYNDQLYTLSNCTQCSELHTFRRIIGCEVEKFPDGTVTSLRAFDEYGFDGEDFMAFDSDTLQWIVKSPKAKETKKKWDQQTERNQFIKNYVEKCMDWISTFNNTHENKKQRAPNDHCKLVLSCLATGFYPRDIEMYIRLNESVLDNQTYSGIRPNANETFQMNTSVEIDINYKGSYDCFVIHSSLTEPVSEEWESQWSVIAVVTVLVLVLAVVSVLALIGILWRCRSKKKGSNGEL
uniref:Immunoglobulin C1-set domain-containing protein n=1 Tax=Sinocyclocheilus anshuiensis TaxID=1608454 RepID=A0A671KRP2_9TELE